MKVKKMTINERMPMIDIQKILDASNYLKSFCVNNNCPCKMPLIDIEQHPFDFDNWDVPDKFRVKEALKILNTYAYDCIHMYMENDISPYHRFDYENVPKKEILPRWVISPYCSPTTLFWRMGIGEDYNFIFNVYYDTLSDYKQKQLLNRYPQPDWYKKLK